MYNLVQPRIIYMGSGALRSLEQILLMMNPKSILMVTGPTIQRLGILERALSSMGSFKKHTEIFINPRPEPDVAIVENCARIVREKGYDLIIGLGGGSPMDVAKGAAVAAVHEGGMRSLLGRNLLRSKGIPVILVPTTAGSGTEVTQAVVVDVPEEGTKKSIWDPRTMAEAAVVDPELTRHMPPRLTAETGLDALVHAIEGHTSRFANPLSRIYTWEAMGLIGKYLLGAYKDGSDMEAREAMARGATLGAMGMTNSGLGAIHALALVLDQRGFTHCQSVAVLAPWVIQFNRLGHEELYGKVAEALGERVQGLTAEKASLKACDALLRFLDEMGISPYLKDYGLKKDEVGSLALKAYQLGQRLLPMNIREIHEKDVITIFTEAYGSEGK